MEHTCVTLVAAVCIRVTSRPHVPMDICTKFTSHSSTHTFVNQLLQARFCYKGVKSYKNILIPTFKYLHSFVEYFHNSEKKSYTSNCTHIHPLLTKVSQTITFPPIMSFHLILSFVSELLS